jgi:hypothetical protein
LRDLAPDTGSGEAVTGGLSRASLGLQMPEAP